MEKLFLLTFLGNMDIILITPTTKIFSELNKKLKAKFIKKVKFMESLFGVNGLMFWSEREIRLRKVFEEHFYNELKTALLKENNAWSFTQVEGPLLTPRTIINQNYTNNDIWVQENHTNQLTYIQAGLNEIETILAHCPDDDFVGKIGFESKRESLKAELENLLNSGYVAEPDLVLRPETTPSSYVYARHLLDTHSGVKPPFVVWQTGKSFRREKDHVTKNMRLKEFYQQEFQCIYTSDTMNDYQEAILEPVRKMIGEMVRFPTRLIESDRLPSYSKRTMDVEVWISEPVSPFEIIPGTENGRWMEVCSISSRTDFPGKAQFQTKKGLVEKDLLVLEIAIGLDRINYCFNHST